MTTNLISTKGDAIDVDIALDQDITGWEIRAEMWDSQSTVVRVRKANAAVTGGGASQIEITDAANGAFQVHFATDETSTMQGDVKLEIEVVNASSKKFTVYSGYVQMDNERITWDATAD